MKVSVRGRATGLARPPHLVATFSLWRAAAQMRAYAYGTDTPERSIQTGNASFTTSMRSCAFGHTPPMASGMDVIRWRRLATPQGRLFELFRAPN
jgi:hypothetical protein